MSLVAKTINVLVLLCYQLSISNSLATITKWSVLNFPNLRNELSCGVSHSLQFICDPDRVLTTTQNEKLNEKLFKLATSQTVCRCERRSECTMEDSTGSTKVHVGFIVVVAIASDIARNTTTSKHGLELVAFEMLSLLI